MSIAQGTLHYDYPQVQLTDRPTFANFNPAFADIDAKLYSLITDSSTMDGRVDTLEASMVTAQNDIAGLRTDVDLANAGVTTNAEAIATLQNTVGGHTATLKTKLDSVAIADAYDSEHGTYSVGDIVTYNGQRYKCITAVTAAEPFDADKWQGEDVQTVLDGIDADLSNQWIMSEHDHGVVLATADGTKTVADLLSDALTAFRAMNIPSGYGWRVHSFIIPISTTARATLFAMETLRTSISSSSNLYGESIDLSGSGVVVRRVAFSSGNFRGAILSGNAVENEVYNSVVPNSGLELSMVYDIYKQL